MVQRHNVVIPRDDGGIEVFPLKEWLRQHPDVLPDLNPTGNTSWRLRSALQRLGWIFEETPNEVRLIQPGAEGRSSTISEILGDPSVQDGMDDISPSFALEYQLRDFLAANIGTIPVNGHRLRLFVDATGRDGVEFPTAVGPIDILATDDNGALFVFELKRANSPDRAIGQLARYMGWVRQTIGKERDVYGVLVARSIGENLRYAVIAVPNVFLYEYKVEFHLQAAHELDRSNWSGRKDARKNAIS
jgi:endonuclease